jgi:hypothetical protein
MARRINLQLKAEYICADLSSRPNFPLAVARRTIHCCLSSPSCSRSDTASLAAYSSFVQFFVAPVGISSQGRTAYVTVGYRLAEQYRILYRNQSSSEVLKDQGYEEDDIERVWTQGSLFATRLMGLMTYLLVLGSINVCIGALARTRDLIEQD